jgi:misacylated tRNA(Ala) deacylase
MCQSKVYAVDVENHAIVLDQTVFYPGGGGQPADTGHISYQNSDLSVTRIRKKGENVFHFIDSQDRLPEVGASVSGKIDWDHRYRLMRTHTALHILCGVVFRDYGALVTGGDMSPLKGRMDFEFERMQKDLVEAIESAVNIEAANNLPIIVSILPREKAFQIPDLIRTKINLLPENIQQVRVVEIVGLDLQADGGTHVKTTGEVGRIKIRDYKSKGRINKRIYLELEE